MNKNTQQLLAELKSCEQDFEWYPTTNEIIKCIKKDYRKDSKGNPYKKDDSPSFLDCGAGDGRVLKALTDGKKYAIEKSEPLLNILDKDIFVVGTNFENQTLIDKKVDVVFSNPPYSEYERWSVKIIRESNAGYIYLVIPSRWQESEDIKLSIKLRDTKAKVIGSFDFHNADRQARAKVDIVRIRLKYGGQWSGDQPKTDPFQIWFEENFKIDINKEESSKYGLEQYHKKNLHENLKQTLVKGGDIVTTLEKFYHRDLDKLIKTYQGLCDIDPSILKELGVNLKGVREALSQKIENLKDRYWHELFNNLSTVTDKLTSESREKLLSILTAHTHVDFSSSNAYAVVLWVIKNANAYFDSQLITIVERMTEKANVLLYKSNKKTFGDEEWRYYRIPEGLSRYQLDYRIVLSRIGGIYAGSWSRDSVNGLLGNAATFIDDLCTIAANLNYDTYGLERVKSFKWESNQKKVFNFRKVTTGKLQTLFEVRAFKNGNLHIKFNQKFICRLNVEFGRLKGWIKSPKEAADELKISEKEAIDSFHSNLKLTGSNLLKLEFNKV